MWYRAVELLPRAIFDGRSGGDVLGGASEIDGLLLDPLVLSEMGRDGDGARLMSYLRVLLRPAVRAGTREQ